MAIASETVSVFVSCVPVRTPFTARPPASIQTKLSPRLFSCCSTRAWAPFPAATHQTHPLDSSLPRFADGHHADYCRDPDGDAQDRQNAPQLVPEQRHQGGLQQSRVI